HPSDLLSEAPPLDVQPPLPAATTAYPPATTLADFRHNLEAVHARIQAACGRVGRDPATVRLLPVSKTIDEARIRLVHAAGCTFLGENKVQEAFAKWEA